MLREDGFFYQTLSGQKFKLSSKSLELLVKAISFLPEELLSPAEGMTLGYWKAIFHTQAEEQKLRGEE